MGARARVPAPSAGAGAAAASARGTKGCSSLARSLAPAVIAISLRALRSFPSSAFSSRLSTTSPLVLALWDFYFWFCFSTRMRTSRRAGGKEDSSGVWWRRRCCCWGWAESLAGGFGKGLKPECSRKRWTPWWKWRIRWAAARRRNRRLRCGWAKQRTRRKQQYAQRHNTWNQRSRRCPSLLPSCSDSPLASSSLSLFSPSGPLTAVLCLVLHHQHFQESGPSVVIFFLHMREREREREIDWLIDWFAAMDFFFLPLETMSLIARPGWSILQP